jgi:GxxExxY protein
MRSAETIINHAITIAIDIHRELGPGLLESSYQGILRDELQATGLTVSSEVLVPVRYKDREYSHGFRADLLVDSMVLIEIKSTERPSSLHARQLLTYLRCFPLRYGLLINMGLERAIDGILPVTNYRVGE